MSHATTLGLLGWSPGRGGLLRTGEAIRCCHDALSSKPLVLSVELTANQCRWDALLEMSLLAGKRIDCLYLSGVCWEHGE